MKRLQIGRLTAAASFAAVLCAAAPSLAHPGHPGHEVLGIGPGLAHPFTGLDHILAMIAVGLWAALRGGPARAIWPATFLTAMAIGFNLNGLSPALLEGGVLASVMLLGGFTAANRQAGDAAGLAVVGAAGLLHGMAHAADVGQAAPGFELGMLVATALLHGAGLCLALALRRSGRAGLVRLIGGGVAASGLVLAVAG